MPSTWNWRAPHLRRRPRASSEPPPFRHRDLDATNEALTRLQGVARSGGNVFEELMETVKVASLGQISNALFEVGGQYRRNM